MTAILLAARSLAVTAHAVWLGGFTFYSGVVLWAVHDEYGSLDAGRITQRVTDWLNAIGVGAVVLWWAVAWLDRTRGPRLARRILPGLLALTTALLGFLIVDHLVLDRRFEVHGLSGFYDHHRVYLLASTVQWAANLLIIPAALRIWQGDEARSPGARGPEADPTRRGGP